MSFYLILAAALLAPGLVAAAELSFGDAARGEKLHRANCQGCHDTRVYTRPDRRVRSVEGLMRQVDMCDQNLRTRLTDEQRSDLVQYLSERHYRFKDQ